MFYMGGTDDNVFGLFRIEREREPICTEPPIESVDIKGCFMIGHGIEPAPNCWMLAMWCRMQKNFSFTCHAYIIHIEQVQQGS